MTDGETGYRKPPLKNQFRKGVSGNPKGRPKKALSSIGDVVKEVIEAPVQYREGDKIKMASRRELTVRALIGLALKGEPAAADMIFALREHAHRSASLGSLEIRVLDWLPDHPGRAAAEKAGQDARQSIVEGSDIASDDDQSSETGGPS